MPEYFVIVIFVICDTCNLLRRVTLNNNNNKNHRKETHPYRFQQYI